MIRNIAVYFDIKNDVAFKKVFLPPQNAWILKHFLNHIMNLKGNKQIRDITPLPQEQPAISGELKHTILDVHCVDESGKEYIIEMQRGAASFNSDRALCYASKSLADQMHRGEKEYFLHPVITIVILDGTTCSTSASCVSHHVMLEVESHEHLFKNLEFFVVELDKFRDIRNDNCNISDTAYQWLYLFSKAPSLDRQPEGIPLEVANAYSILHEHSWGKKERDEYDACEKARLRFDDCIKHAEERGEERGKKVGIDEERKRSLEQLKKTQYDSAKILNDQEISWVTINEATGFNQERFNEYEKELERVKRHNPSVEDADNFSIELQSYHQSDVLQEEPVTGIYGDTNMDQNE